MSALRPAPGTLSLLLLSLAACRVEPSVGGESLTCTDSCPGEMRCVDGVCLDNSPPELAPISAQTATVGLPFTLLASAEDADGDEVTLTWTQVEGPHVALAEPLVAAELTVTFVETGLFVFDLAADDGFDSGTPLQIAVTAENAVPVIEVIDDRVVELTGAPVPVTLTPTVTDDDGHAVTLTWTQVIGPEVLAAPVEGATLSFDASELGLYQFEVVADDGYQAAAPVVARVLAQPALEVVYARWSDEAPASDCGSIDAPCPTLAAAVEVMKADQIDTLLVASSEIAYPGCLDLGAGERVFGARHPASWERDPRLRATTLIACDTDSGHVVAGDGAEIHDVRLAFTKGASPAPNLVFAAGDEDERAFVTTLRLGAGTPWLENVDVAAAICGEGCKTMGIASIDGSPLLEGVEVFASLSGFTSVEDFYGIYLLGGAPVLRATSETVDLEPVVRGGVTLNAPVDQAAVGITSGRSDVTLEGLTVTGGLADELLGINVLGATYTDTGSETLVGHSAIQDTVLDLMSFGSRAVAGLQASDCYGNAWPCLCPSLPATDCTPPDPADTYFVANLEATDNAIRLQGSVADSGLVPCIGAGVTHASVFPGLELVDNRIAVDGAFSFALGVTLFGFGDLVATAPESPILIQGNDVRVADGRVSHVCEMVTAPLDGQRSGNVGLFAGGGRGTTVFDNRFAVGNHESAIRGLVATGVQEMWLEQNIIEVGQRDGDILAEKGTGVRLAESYALAVGERSTFTRNEVRLGYGILNGDAVELAGTWPWLLSNNFISSGPTLYGTGVAVGWDGWGASEWPKLYHNTIHAGWGLLGRAVVIKSALGDNAIIFGDNDFGVFAHNLLDAGEPNGERLLIFDPGNPTFEHVRGNLGQFVGSIAGPTPSLIIPPGAGNTGIDGVVTGGGAEGDGSTGIGYAMEPFWTVLFTGSGTLTNFKLSPLRRADGLLTFGPPVAAWSGADRGVNQVVVITEIPPRDGDPPIRLLAVAPIEGGQVAAVKAVRPKSSSGGRHPFAAVMADANRDAIDDLFFIELASGAAVEDTLWRMTGIAGGGWWPAEEVARATTMRFVDVDSDGDEVFYVADDDDGSTVAPAVFALLADSNPLAEGPTRVSTIVEPDPDMAAIERFAVIELLDEGEAEETAGDFLFVIDGGLHVAVRSARDGEPTAATFNTVPCNGSRVAAFTAGDAIDDGDQGGYPRLSRNEIVVGCNDGRVEIFEATVDDVDSVSLDRVSFATLVGTINGLAVGANEGGLGQSLIMVSLLGDGHSLATLPVVRVTGNVNNAATDALPLLADAVHLDTNDQPQAMWRDNTLDGELLPMFATACALEARELDGDPYDLRLAGDTNDPCVDVVNEAGITDPELAGFDGDIDRTGARADGLLDIGADELGP